MIKIIFFLTLTGIFFTSNVMEAQSFHSLNIAQEGKPDLFLSSLKGKKILVLVTNPADEKSMSGVDTLQLKYSELIVIQLPVRDLRISTDSSRSAVSYSNKNFITASDITDSTSSNAKILSWISRKEMNKHFNTSELKSGQKFILDEQGELFAVLPENFKLTNALLDYILRRELLPTK